MLLFLPLEIIQKINYFLDCKSQIDLKNIKKDFKIKITDIYLSNRGSQKITNDILRKYMYTERLNLYCNINVTDISFLSNIEMLNISGGCQVDTETINCKKIKILNISNNISNFDLEKFTSLQKLIADGICNITVEQINKLNNLKYLSVVSNPINKKINKIKNKNITIQTQYFF